MGYLDNSIVTVDAILTTKGRQLLAQGNFNITQFAFADDEIDYTLYNPTHPSGSVYFGEAIENMPLLEAFPQEAQVMKYKLTTLPRGTARLPIIGGINAEYNLQQGATISITPQTLNYLGSNTFETSGYTFTISDARLFNSFEGIGITTPQAQALNTTPTPTLGTAVSKTVVGSTVSIRATTVNTIFGSTQRLTATLTIEGRDSGARITVPFIVTKPNT
jgi:hypothetical protein